MNDEFNLDELGTITGGAPDMDAVLVQFAKSNQDVFNNLDAMTQEEVRLGILSNSTREYLQMVYEGTLKARDESELSEQELEGVGMKVG